MSQNLPEWNTTTFFPSLESPEFVAAFDSLFTDIASLDQLANQHGIQKLETMLNGAEAAAILEQVLHARNAVQEKLRLVYGFIACFTTTNSRNDLAQAKASELQMANVRLGKLSTRLAAWVGSLDLDSTLQYSEIARDHLYGLQKMQFAAKHQMSAAEEDLSSSLSLSGSSAWAKLHSDITSRLEVMVQGERIPMSATRAAARHESAERRQAAYAAELAAWETVEVPLAAALNSIKGEVNVLWQRRGFEDALAPSLHGANIDRQTLHAMHQACEESFPDFRRYLKQKAKLLGVKNLVWCDMLAPVGQSGRSWEWQEGTEFIAQQFGSYSPKLEAFARRSLSEGWIDAAPRPGKRDGAFCMGVRGDESRILMNFEPSLDSLSTLAHELGHGYHNLCLKDRTALQRTTPMTLAETASIFCETIVSNAALQYATPLEKIYILDTELQGQTQVVVDIHSRFLFESELFKRREKRELSVQELKTLMLESQAATYGDGLDSSNYHPYMWAVKGHYYGSNFYNFPYTFGLLFGLGLYAQYLEQPETFRTNYDALLSQTGMADAATLAAGFGIEIRTPDFWQSSLNQIRARINEFCDLVEQV
jgi:oligoendopeptidase F